MLDQTAASALGDLRDAFPQTTLQPGTTEAYARALSDVDPSALERAVRRIIRTRTEARFPTVGEIRAAVAEDALGLPGEVEALGQIDGRMRWARQPESARDPDDEPPFVHPAVMEALNLVGGFSAMRASERPEVLRGQMLRFFREIRDREIAHAQVELPPGAARAALPPTPRVS